LRPGGDAPFRARRFIYLYIDAIFVNARVGYRISKVPVLVVGVRENREKELLTMELLGSQSERHGTASLRIWLIGVLVNPL
jgi:transposase-like protein